MSSYTCFLLFSKFDHPHILKLLGVCLLNEPQYLILELMEGGDLLSYLRGARKKKVKTIRVIFLTCNCPQFLSFSLYKSPCWCSAVLAPGLTWLFLNPLGPQCSVLTLQSVLLWWRLNVIRSLTKIVVSVMRCLLISHCENHKLSFWKRW